jgi:hypothetical protein
MQFGRLTPEQLRAFDDDGFLVVPKVLSRVVPALTVALANLPFYVRLTRPSGRGGRFLHRLPRSAAALPRRSIVTTVRAQEDRLGGSGKICGATLTEANRPRRSTSWRTPWVTSSASKATSIRKTGSITTVPQLHVGATCGGER